MTDLSQEDVDAIQELGADFKRRAEAIGQERGLDPQITGMIALQHAVAIAIVEMCGEGPEAQRLMQGISLFTGNLVPLVNYHATAAQLRTANDG